MRKYIVAVSVFLSAAPLMAETYTWVDEGGTVNFTDSYEGVPAQYRKKARTLGDMGAVPSGAASNAAPDGANSGRVGAGTQAEITAGEANDLYGGRKAEAWQQEMRPLYAEVQRLEQQLVSLENLIKNPAGISKSRFDGLPQEFRETQKLYNQALKQYNSQNDEANKVGLPAEYRK